MEAIHEKVRFHIEGLSDPNRLRALAALLSEPELCACRIKELLNVSGTALSPHPALLIQTYMVDSRKDGNFPL
ncbi:MAG: hypothetical protein AB7S77_04915 [Desulfatirhabdiaceae bacterium]